VLGGLGTQRSNSSFLEFSREGKLKGPLDSDKKARGFKHDSSQVNLGESGEIPIDFDLDSESKYGTN
jgi:hypothetical protein